MYNNFSYLAIRYKYGIDIPISRIDGNLVVFCDKEKIYIAEIRRRSANYYTVGLACPVGVWKLTYRSFKECVVRVKEFFKD